jgi:hypothetical protein
MAEPSGFNIAYSQCEECGVGESLVKCWREEVSVWSGSSHCRRHLEGGGRREGERSSTTAFYRVLGVRIVARRVSKGVKARRWGFGLSDSLRAAQLDECRAVTR